MGSAVEETGTGALALQGDLVVGAVERQHGDMLLAVRAKLPGWAMETSHAMPCSMEASGWSQRSGL